MDDDSDIDTLAQLFPDATQTKLRNALASAQGDPNLASTILLSEMSMGRQGETVAQLASMFPDRPRAVLQRVLEDSGSLDAAVEVLLGDASGDSFGDAFGDALPKALPNKREASGKASGKARGLATSQDSGPAIVQKYGYVSKRVAEDLCAQYSDPIRALIQLVYTCTSTGINTGTSSCTSTATNTPTNTSNDLSDLLHSPRLSSISPRFLEKALEYFHGDHERTAALLILIAEHNYGKHTGYYRVEPGPGPGLRPGPGPGQGTSSIRPGISSVRSQIKAIPKASPKASTSTIPKAISSPINGTRDGPEDGDTLDFHGWLPEDAATTAAQRLARWWATELAQRELNNTRLNQIDAVHVSPVTLVTGRGLHSTGGVPRVRIRVQRMLDELNYVYIEEPSRFTVTGRRRIRQR